MPDLTSAAQPLLLCRRRDTPLQAKATPHGMRKPVPPPLVRRTPGISCEAVRTAAKRRNARGGTAVRLTGAATSFVCFIPLFDGSALPGFTQDSTMPLRATILASAPSAAGTSEDPGVARRLPQLARAVPPLPFFVMHQCP